MVITPVKPMPTPARTAAPKPAADQEPEDRVETSVKTPLSHKVTAALCLGSGVAIAANIVRDVASQPGVGNKVATGALALGAAVAGYVSADLVSGVFHHFIDNYPNEDTPIIGNLAYEFQTHHHNIHSLEKSSYLTNLHEAGKVMWVPLLATAALNPGPLASAFSLAFLEGAYLAQGSHRWAHMDNPPAIAKVLQKVGLAQPKPNHQAHHKMPWDDYYCIVNGMWNKPLGKIDFFRKWEKAIHKVTGAEPNSWKDPAVKAFALGEIDKDEFLKQKDLNRAEFARMIRAEWAATDAKMAARHTQD
ncbi:MAG: fatty acid desaturase CarF family protein [Vulcanimicrobiota bacterium]